MTKDQPSSRKISPGIAFAALTVLGLLSEDCDAAPEPWKLQFDGREWPLVEEIEGEEALVRRYLPRGEDTYRWTEMVQSRISRVYRADSVVSPYTSDAMYGLKQACKSLEPTVIAESQPRNLTVVWQAPDCQFHLPLQGILRVDRVSVSGRPINVELHYVVKNRKMSPAQQADWTQRIRTATPAGLAETLEAANASIERESSLDDAKGKGGLGQLSAERMALAYLQNENLLRIIVLGKAGVPTRLHGSGPPQEVSAANANEVGDGFRKTRAELMAELARRGAARLAPAYTQGLEPNCNLPSSSAPAHPELTVHQEGNTLTINAKGNSEEKAVGGVVVGNTVAIPGDAGYMLGRLEGSEILFRSPTSLGCNIVLRPSAPF